MNQKALLAGAGKAPLVFPEGYFPWERFGGIHDGLSVRVLLLRGRAELCVVSVELPSLKPYSLIGELKTFVHGLTGTAPEHIWICVTHNVSAPHVPPAEQYPEKYAGHLKMVKDAIQSAAGQALAGLRPAKVGTGHGEAYVNVNRDIPTADGWWLGIEGTGPSDKTVSVIRLADMDNRPIALLFSYAVKTAVMDEALMPDGCRYVTADLTGRACQIAEARYGVPVLYWMGPAADQVPRKKAQYYTTDDKGHLKEINHGEQGFQWVDELGAQLGESILDAAERAVPKEDVPVLVTRRELTFPGQKCYPRHLPYLPIQSYTYLPDREQTVAVEILRAGDAVVLGVQPEVTSLIGMMLRQKSPFRHTMLVSMVNGGMNYMSDETAYDRLAFEGTHSVLWRGAAERFVEQMVPILREIRGDNL